MPEDEEEPPDEAERPVGAKGRRWFRPNRGGAGWHPASWQGWLILVAGVAVIAAIVVLLRTGVV